jgi:predicted DNA binding CopG/RHH family protein
MTTTEAPIMVRVDITRDELAALKIEAIHAGMTVQKFLAYLIRQRLES